MAKKKQAHTPGPWSEKNTFGGTSRFEFDIVAPGSEPGTTYTICSLTLYHDTRSEVKANMALICAAPEMLGQMYVLLNTLKKLKKNGHAVMEGAIEKCQSVILKAEGRDDD